MAKKPSKSNPQQPQSAMAQLLAKHKSDFVALKKGESVKGKITKLTPNEILVDLGVKTEATILEKDKSILRTILSMFKVGDTVEVNVLNPESESGQPVVSLRRFLGNLAWGKLETLQKSKETVDVTIAEVGKAGYVVTTAFGITGFLPQSHTSQLSPQDNVVGQKIGVSVLEVSRSDNKVIFSQKTKISDEDFEKVTKKYKTGQKVEVTVSNVTPFGLFVLLDTFEGFIHISEVAWEKVEDLSDTYSQGQKIEAVIIRFDKESKRINLSVKKLTEDPFEELIKEYPVDKKISGKVKKVEDQGVTLEFEGGVEGFIKKDKIPPTMTFAADQEVTVTVSEHDKRKHRIVVTPVLKEKPIGYR
jgi:small subunit ribosomal protein S1